MRTKSLFFCVFFVAVLFVSSANADSSKNNVQVNNKSLCVFPNSKDAAPLWVCEENFSDYEIVGLGMARLSKGAKKETTSLFMVAALSSINMISGTYANKFKKGQKYYVETTPEFLISQSSLNSGFILANQVSFQSFFQQFSNYEGRKLAKELDQISLSVKKFSLKCPDPYTIWKYDRSSGFNESESVFSIISEEGKPCSNEALLTSLSNVGIRYIASTTSPSGDFYLALGVKKASDLKVESIY